MTDARLRGEWIGKIKFDNLSDTAWRVFTIGMMWSAEQGTDGYIPTRYMKTIHPDGEQPDAVREVARAGLWEVSDNGVQFVDWDGALGQSTALQVETAKEAARGRQRAYRERERMKQARSVGFTDTTVSVLNDLPPTGDVTRDVTPHVGEGKGKGKGAGDHLKERDAETSGERVDPLTGEVTDSWSSSTSGKRIVPVNRDSTSALGSWETVKIPNSDSTRISVANSGSTSPDEDPWSGEPF